MSTRLPEVVDADAVTDWDVDVDVIVVGFGIGGGCAAVEAAQAGARVLVLEKAAVAGGTTSMAGGHFYLGGGTAVQKATGHDDSPKEMAKFLTAMSCEPEPDKITAYCEDSPAHLDWLEGLGFEFERSYYPEKAVIQPGTQGLMYTGNEKVHPFRDQAKPAPRGHKVPVEGDTGGAAMVINLLVKRAEQLGVQVRYETGATNLVTDSSGAVVGVAYKHFSQKGFAKAKAVVLGAGGFVMNKEMVAEHTPKLAKKPWVLGSTYDDGLGIRMGQSVGGWARFMDQAFITAPVYPPSRLLTGIVVNKDGQRIVAEDSYHSRTSALALEQRDSAAYLIVDSAHIEHPEFPLAPFIDGWETIPEMESALGIPDGALAATLQRYNDNAANKEDPDFGKHPEWLEPQNEGPWGAYDLTLGTALYAGFTLGGLATTVNGQVRREDNQVIPGLYAVGAMAANLAQDAKGYASGTQLGEGSYFGRRAGRHAAKAATQPEGRPL